MRNNSSYTILAAAAAGMNLEHSSLSQFERSRDLEINYFSFCSVIPRFNYFCPQQTARHSCFFSFRSFFPPFSSPLFFLATLRRRLFVLISFSLCLRLCCTWLQKLSVHFGSTGEWTFFAVEFSSSLLAIHSERDKYIKVNWSNIREGAYINFKQFLARVSMFGTPYDYESIIHYSPVAFAKDRSIPTIIPLYPAKNMGQRDGELLIA